MSEQIQLSEGVFKLVSVSSQGVISYDDPGQWKCLKCYDVVKSSENPPVYCSSCKRNSQFEVVSPPVFREPWRSYGEPIVFSELDSLYARVMEFIQDHLVLRNVEEQMVMALWVIASYRQQDFFTAPYLQFIGAIESGKTRALEVLHMLSYRAVNLISISPPALCRLIELYHPTVLLDQAERKFDVRSERGREMYDIFMSGYKKMQLYIVADKDSTTEVISRNVFGFKAIASTRRFDEALASRSITYKMMQGIPKVKDFTEESYTRADELRNMLLYLHLKQDALPRVNPTLSGRRREIFMPLLRAGCSFEISEEDLAEYLQTDKEVIAGELTDTVEADILREIEIILHGIDEQEKVAVSDIAMRLDIKPIIVGHRLKNMNIQRKHGYEGAYIDLTDKRTQEELAYLFSKYHVKAF